MARTKQAGLEAEFKHGTSIGPDGEILYDCPIEINDDADMRNFGITKQDCRYLHFNGSQRMRVYFYKILLILSLTSEIFLPCSAKISANPLILYCPGPGIPLFFNSLSFFAL